MNKEKLLSMIVGCTSAVVTTLYGGWTYGMSTLCILMLIDYVFGLIVAGVFHASPKSESGRLESNAGWKGLIRKFVVLLIIACAYRLDMMLEITYLRDAMTVSFSVNEIISILENAGLMGIPIPKKMKDAIEILKNK